MISGTVYLQLSASKNARLGLCRCHGAHQLRALPCTCQWGKLKTFPPIWLIRFFGLPVGVSLLGGFPSNVGGISRGNFKSDFTMGRNAVSKKSPTGPTERTPKKPEYHIARSQLTEQGPLVRSYSIFDGQLGYHCHLERLNQHGHFQDCHLLMENGHDPFPNHDLYGLAVSFHNVVSGKTGKTVFLLTLLYRPCSVNLLISRATNRDLELTDGAV